MRLPRKVQWDMIQGLNKTPRRQLIASMGCGKTGAILTHATGLEMLYGRWPGLVICAPLQVCYAWRNEVPLWRPDLKVNLICGSMAQRTAGIQNPGDVNVVSYDSLPWLAENGPADWSQAFGSMMVCDESTRIKMTRASWQTSSLGKKFLRTDGGVQTNALAKQNQHFSWWVNATGTPSPNGLTDLWGQYWHLDAGHRLGGSYTSFEQRWFRVPHRNSEFAKVQPLPGAEDAIAALVADITTVCRVEDYFDVAQPNVIDRFVELPPKARKAYNEMRNKMVTQIQDGLKDQTITVHTAAAKVAKLLQVASGFMYHTDEEEDPDFRLCQELHTAKVEAVESILVETNEPLVVVYYHKASLEQLKKKFKNRLVELDKDGRAQDAWSAGKIEILAFQYKRGAMGLNLQHGGRNICLFAPTFVADDYAQVLERLGPLRQMQSGYNRVVNVFRIQAVNTEDARVYQVAEGKLTAEQALVGILNATQA